MMAPPYRPIVGGCRRGDRDRTQVGGRRRARPPAPARPADCVRAISRRGTAPTASPCACASWAPAAVGDDIDHAVLTIKAGGGLARTEVELPVEPEQVGDLWDLTDGRRIDKVRHRVELGETDAADEADLEAEVDVYSGDLAGLCTVEVEFASTDAAARFVAPTWFGVDVTGDDRWSNAALAEHGRPAEP